MLIAEQSRGYFEADVKQQCESAQKIRENFADGPKPGIDNEK